jgi:hypothetical protein
MDNVKALISKHVDTQPKKLAVVIVSFGLLVIVVEGLRWAFA